jgi:hypothetical protein
MLFYPIYFNVVLAFDYVNLCASQLKKNPEIAKEIEQEIDQNKWFTY